MIFAFLILGLTMVFLYFIAGDKFGGVLIYVDKREYPLKGLMPPALYLLDIAGYRYTTGYDRRVLGKITEIYGPENSRHYLKAHHGNRIVIVSLGLLFIAFIGSQARIDVGFGIFALALLAAGAYFPDKSLEEKLKKKRLNIRLDFPDFMNKFTLLINAGLTIARSWEKAVIDNRKQSQLYRELEAVLTEIRSGVSEQRAYENFAKRCRTPEITRFISIMLQNARKGNSEIVPVLRVQGNECWEMRKTAARRMGEEASTRMLLPLMLMFIAILLITVAPAVIAMRGAI